MEQIPIANRTMDLDDCRGYWSFDDQYGCWCLEDILYTAKAEVPKFQRMSVFVPAAYMNADGTVNSRGSMGGYTARTAPVVFENNSAGYMQMPHTWLGGPRCYAEQYLAHGLVYVTCGCRGRDSKNAAGEAAGKAPLTLVDLKTAIRFLRHNRAVLPGDYDRIISVGWSAGGAMSTLLGVTGDNVRYDPWLRENGAFMEESDSVYAAQIYCPIIDLEHADMAYEWCFLSDKTCEDSPAGPAEIMTPFKEALSRKLAGAYIGYVNSLELKHPQTGELLTLESLRKGSFYDYLMNCLNQSATEFLQRLSGKQISLDYDVQEYLSGNYTCEVPLSGPGPAHHAGPGTGLQERPVSMALGDLVSRPPKGVPFIEMKPVMEKRQGTDKRDWLKWDGSQAEIIDLDTYILCHRRRMKPCTAFDKLTNDSGENQEFGNGCQDYVHFSRETRTAVRELINEYPQETAVYLPELEADWDESLAERIFLINPMNFIGTDEQSNQAKHYRIRVGACDADTSFTVVMTLAIRLANAGYPTDYAMVWDQPHSEADYPGEVLHWIDKICR